MTQIKSNMDKICTFFKKHNKLVLTMAILIIFVGYIILSARINSSWMFPEPEEKGWFNLDIDTFGSSPCLVFVDGINLKLNDKDNQIEIWGTIEKRCDFDKKMGLMVDLNYSDPNKKPMIDKNLPPNTITNITNNYLYILFDPPALEKFNYYNYSLVVNPKNDFYNFYRFSSDIGISYLSIKTNDDLKDGFNCDENCFEIYNNIPLQDESRIYKGEEKRYWFNETEIKQVILRFDPQSNFWLLIQKFLDVIVLGIEVTLIYNLGSHMCKSIHQRRKAKNKDKIKKQN